jgi:uncharacterized protein (TIGR02271 family)
MNEQQAQQAIGQNLYSADGAKIGTVAQVYLDDVTGQPEWATVQTGMFGTKESFVPISQSEFSSEGLRVSYDKATIKDAPQIDADGHLSEEQEAELYRHYGLDDELARTGQKPARQPGGMDNGGAGHDTSGPTTDDAMTRSEEQLRVGTEKVQAGKARLRKYVVTENVSTTVPVTREEVRVEREPITAANRPDAMDGPAISEEEHEVVLTEERVVVNKETVPVERVKLATETVTEDQVVSEEVRKEQIETEGDVRANTRR